MINRSIILGLRYTLIFFILLTQIIDAEGQPVDGKKHKFVQIAEFEAPEANQAVGVDNSYFYAIDNTKIAKYDKKTGKKVAVWEGSKVTFKKLPNGEQRLEKGGPIIHLDSAVFVDGLLYCAHSNYPIWPMTSSIEIWDPNSMKHIKNYSFGILFGSFTWLDRYNGYWWGGFANYDQPYGEGGGLYGNKRNTKIVKMNNEWQIIESWILPDELLEKFEKMSNSGGSWGPDGFLYLTGHDPAEVYRCKLPEAGSIIEVLETIPLNIRGQGIAWDRSEPGIIYGIIRANSQEKAAGKTHRVTVSKLVEIKE